MRAAIERLVHSLPLDPRARRALDETLADWRQEDEAAAGRFARWICDVRSAISVLRALVLVYWWRPSTPLAQPYRATDGLSARDEMMGVISGLAPDSSYEDILSALAALRAKNGGQTEIPVVIHDKPSRISPQFPRRLLRTAALFVTVSLVGGFLQIRMTTPMYRAAAMVRVERDETVGAQSSPSDSDYFIQTESSVLQSRDLKRRVAGKLGLALQRQLLPELGRTEIPAEAAVIDALAAGLAITSYRTSSLVAIKFYSTSPGLATAVANAVAEEYAAQNLERRRQKFESQLKGLTENLDAYRAKMTADRRTLLAGASGSRAVDTDVMARQVSTAMSEFGAKQNARLAAEQRAKEMQALDPEKDLEGALAHPDILAATAALRGQRQQLWNKRQEYLNRQGLGMGHPLVREMDGQIAQVTNDLKAEVQNQTALSRRRYDTALGEQQLAEKILTQQQVRQLENNRRVVSFQVLNQDIATSQTLYDKLLEQQRETEILKKGITNNVTIVDHATPETRPYKPDTTGILVLWLSIGLIAAALTALASSRRKPAPELSPA